jgi:hypothetical protein
MKNNEEIKIPYPKLTWKLIILIVLIILSFRINPNEAFGLLRELFEWIKLKF